MVLTQYIARAGVCSRRNATLLVKDGKVRVNEVVITDPAYRVKENDKVKVEDEYIKLERKIYVLMNKPKGYITTVSDEKNRKTVMDLMNYAPNVRLYPVGRLDRATTGVLLMTNDGALAQKLSHPSYGVAKVYHVELDRTFMAEDMEHVRKGFRLYDGFIKADDIEYVPNMPRSTVAIELHSGKNRIVRRIFEHLRYRIESLDRIAYAGLTKHGIKRGMWRLLSDDEVSNLYESFTEKENNRNKE